MHTAYPLHTDIQTGRSHMTGMGGGDSLRKTSGAFVKPNYKGYTWACKTIEIYVAVLW